MVFLLKTNLCTKCLLDQLSDTPLPFVRLLKYYNSFFVVAVAVECVVAVSEKQSSFLLIHVWVSLQYFLEFGQKLEMPQGTDCSRQISSELSTQK
jgi:hypothetical protein